MAFSRLSIVSVLLITLAFLSGCNTGFGRSSNNDLESLSVTSNSTTLALDPSFSKDQTRYTRTVGPNTGTITISAQAEHELATMTLQGVALANDESRDFTLAPGENTFRIVVEAENERKKTYTVVVTQNEVGSSDATISDLRVINGDLNEAFSSEDNNYTINISGLQGGIRVAADFNDEAIVTLDDVGIGSGQSREVIFEGRSASDNIDYNILAGDGNTSLDYSIAPTVENVDQLFGEDFQPANIQDQDELGYAIALTEEHLAIGAPGEDSATEAVENAGADASGAVFVYNRNGIGDDFLEDVQIIKAESAQDVVSAVSNARFGHAIDMNDEFLVVGAPALGIALEGQVYVYRHNGTNWVFNAVLNARTEGSSTDEYGYSVSLDDNVLVVGAPGVNKVFVYEYDDAWGDPETIAPDSTPARFGHSVSVHVTSDLEAEFVVGAPGIENDPAAGVVTIYEKQNGTWSTTGTLIRETDKYGAHAGDRFGYAVALQYDTLAIGAPGDNFNKYGIQDSPTENEKPADSASPPRRGAVYIFNRDSGEWSINQHYIKPPDIANATDNDNATNFGDRLSMSVGTIAIGYAGESSDALTVDDGQGASEVYFSSLDSDRNTIRQNSGGVLLYTKTVEENKTWQYQGLFKSKVPEGGEKFGSAVDLYKGEMAVGASSAKGIETQKDTAVGAGYLVR